MKATARTNGFDIRNPSANSTTNPHINPASI